MQQLFITFYSDIMTGNFDINIEFLNKNSSDCKLNLIKKETEYKFP